MTFEEWKGEVEAIVHIEYGLTPENCEARGILFYDYFQPYDYPEANWSPEDAAAEIMSALFELERVED